MIYIKIIVSILLVIGCFLLLNLQNLLTKNNLKLLKRYAGQKVLHIKNNKHLSLKKQIDLLKENKKSNFFVKNFAEARDILNKSKQESKIKSVKKQCIIWGIVGFVIALICKNIFLIPTLAIGLALIPLWIVKLTESYLKKTLNDELEVALSSITISYVRNKNLVQAVEENLVNINAPVKQVFLTFYNENKIINSNIIQGIRKMKMSLDSHLFHEWCDAMIQCQNDSFLNVTLYPIVNKFSELKIIQTELDTLMIAPFRDYIVLAIIVLLTIPLLYLLNPIWYHAIVGTVAGKLILSITSIVIFYGINKSINLSKPIEYRR